MRSLYKKKHDAPDKAVYTTKTELYYYLHFLDTNPVIQEFLRHDNSFRLADKYLIAMVFIYFKRAQLSPEDYTKLNFFAGLCLAHSMEEDAELSSEIYPWALGNELKEELPSLLELKVLLWVAMDYRAAVSRHCCKQVSHFPSPKAEDQWPTAHVYASFTNAISIDYHFKTDIDFCQPPGLAKGKVSPALCTVLEEDEEAVLCCLTLPNGKKARLN